MDLGLVCGHFTLARITKCEVYTPSRTFSGIEAIFEFTIEPTNLVTGENTRLEKLVFDLYVKIGSEHLYLGQIKDKFITPSHLNYSKEQQLNLRLNSTDFLKLVDETHDKDLEFKLFAQSLVNLDAPTVDYRGNKAIDAGQVFLKGEGYIRFPHSEWLKLLNSTKIERFDLITLRTTLPELPSPNVFTQAFDKLHEAQDKFNRGDWNAVGSTCRDALNTVLSLAAPSKSKIKEVLSTVISDPQRESFGNAAEQAIDKVRDLLNYATHQGGNAAANKPPANLQREDALLTLHLTAAAISYIAAVYK